jgi:hypothetical protein
VAGERVGGAIIELFPKLAEGAKALVTREGAQAGEGFAAGFSRAGSKLSAVGGKMSKFVTLPLLAVGVEAFVAASKLEKVEGRTERVFGGMSKSVEDFAEHAATSLGQSTTEALTATDKFGAMFRGMGIGRPQALKMSETLDKLGVDLASFNGVPVATAMKALTSGVAGATRGLKPLGIVIDSTAIKAEALRLGLVKGNVDLTKVQAAQFRVRDALVAYSKAIKDHGKNSEAAHQASERLTVAQQGLAKSMKGGTVPALTAAQKAQATYSLILQQSKLAQGDFARNSDNAANRTKILHAQFENLSENLGKSLLPLGNQLLGWVTKLVGGFNGLSPHAQHLIVLFGGIAAAIGPALFVIGKVTSGIGKLISVGAKVGSGLGKLGPVVSKLGPAFSKMGTLISESLLPLLSNPVFLAIAGIVALGVAFYVAYRKIKPFHDAVDAVGRFFKREWKPILVGAALAIGLVVAPVLALAAGFVLAYTKIGFFRSAIDAVGRFIARIPGYFIAADTAILRFFTSLPGRVIGALGNVAGRLLNAGKSLLSGFYNGVVVNAARLYVWWQTLPIRIVAKLAGIGARLAVKGVEAIGGMYLGILRGAVQLFQWWGRLERRILSALGNVGAWLVSKGSALIGGFLNGQVRGWGRIASFLGSIGSRAVHAVGALGDALYDIGRQLITGFLRGIEDAWQHVTGFLGHAGGAVVSTAKKIFGIHSPSTVFREIGQNLSEGLALGIADRHPQVIAAMARTQHLLDAHRNAGTFTMRAPSWHPTATSGVAAAAAAPVVGGDVVFQSLDPRELAWHFWDEAARKRISSPI